MTRATLVLMALLVAASSCGSPAKEPPAKSFRDIIKLHAREDARVDAFSTRADQARILGDSSAKVWVVAVVDFQCGDCRRWYEEVLPTLRTGPIAAGQVRVALLQMPMASHLNAMTSGVAAVCAADEGRFWETTSRIFATQDQWKDLPDARPFLDSVAIGTGVDATRHRQCTERARGMKLVQTDAERSRAAGVDMLPTFFIGTHRVVGYTSAAAFRTVLDSALQGR
jgi:protein-disulfide isomerase